MPNTAIKGFVLTMTDYLQSTLYPVNVEEMNSSINKLFSKAIFLVGIACMHFFFNAATSHQKPNVTVLLPWLTAVIGTTLKMLALCSLGQAYLKRGVQ